MTIVRFKGERSMDELLRRLYEFPSDHVRREAESALLTTNPILVSLANLGPGTPLVVPEVGGAHVREQSDLDSIPAIAAEHQALDEVLDELAAAAERDAAGAQAAIDHLKAPGLRSVPRAGAEVVAAVSELRAEAKRRLAEAGRRKKGQKKAIDGFRDALDRL